MRLVQYGLDVRERLGHCQRIHLASALFAILNDMLDAWSNERMLVPYQTEVIFNLNTGVYQYTIGAGGTIGGSFTGSIAGSVLLGRCHPAMPPGRTQPAR